VTGIEYVCIAIVLVFGVVGIVRKYPRELGVTTMCVAALLLLVQFGDAILTLLQGTLGGEFAWLASPRFEAGFMVAIFLVVIFVSYQGMTLSFKGIAPEGPVSHLLGLLVGLLNGYFITGTPWFYLHRHGYPFGLVDGSRLSGLAMQLLEYLPPQLFEPHPGYLLALLLLLLILSVWR
jgi:hypothetical protein